LTQFRPVGRPFGNDPRILVAVGSAHGVVNQFAAERNTQELSIRYVSGPRNQNSLFFLNSTNTPVRAVLRPILLIGGLSGVRILQLPGPIPFVRTDLLVQDRCETFGDCAQRCCTCDSEKSASLEDMKRFIGTGEITSSIVTAPCSSVTMPRSI
jgi:hypothetical protein